MDAKDTDSPKKADVAKGTDNIEKIEKVETPNNNTEKEQDNSSPETAERMSRLKAAFLYILIGGLALATIVSVMALLIGEFNTAIVKSLLTIFIFFSHGLLILALLWSDRYNQVGKLVLPTSILVLTFANMITTTLGTWDVINDEVAFRAFSFYVLILGAAYMITGILRLRLSHQSTQIALFSSLGLTIATVLALGPWVLDIFDYLDPAYYRIVAALSILATASFLIGLVFRGIALGHNPALKSSEPAKNPTSNGMKSIYISVGVITAMFWLTGFTSFVSSGIQSANSSSYSDSHNYN